MRGPLTSHYRLCLLHRSALPGSRPLTKRVRMSCLFDNPPPSSVLNAFGFYSRTIIFKQLSATPNRVPYAFLPLTLVNGSSCVAAHRNNHKLDSLH